MLQLQGLAGLLRLAVSAGAAGLFWLVVSARAFWAAKVCLVKWSFLDVEAF